MTEETELNGTTVIEADQLEAAVDAIARGELVVYPTETVYGLGANALDGTAVERVFAAKKRDRNKPLSMAVESVSAVEEYVPVTGQEREFMQAFLPGPVTVVVSASEEIPSKLLGGRKRVGIRVPDNEIALKLLSRTPPLTATSANVSGTESARTVGELDDAIRETVAAVIDGGETPGGGSTVVDIENAEIHRRGPLVGEISSWLTAQKA